MSVPANQIPAHPGVAAQAAAAGPAARTAQDNNMIPGNPTVQANLAAARMGQAAPTASQQQMGADFDGDPDGEHSQSDWFSAAGVGAPTPERHLAPPPAPPAAPASQGQPQQTQQPTYSEIDALLDGIQIPGEVQQPQVQQPGQVTQGQQQPTTVPPSQQQQAPSVQAPQAAPAAAPQFDAEAAQKAAIDQLMGRDYVLSEADQRRLIAEPETVIPRLAAQVHVNVVRDIGSRIGPIVQALIAQGVDQRLEGMRRETEFFGRYPKLANPAFRPIVERSLAMVKAANPNITQEQLFQEGASYAAFQIRSQFRTQGSAPPAPPAMRAPSQGPYVPFSPGAPPVPQAPQGGNVFADLANATDLFDW